MLNLEVKSKVKPGKAIQKIKDHFGKGGLGLQMTAESEDCLSFEGGGGFVTAIVCEEGKFTKLKFETREWENDVKKFVEKLK